MIWTNIKLAWRNIFRNKRRSFIAGTAIGLGLASLIFTDGLMVGMVDNMITSATASFLGEGQIHSKGFRKTQAVEETIQNADWVLKNLEKESSVEHFSPRILSFGMITSAANTSSVALTGVNPDHERDLSQIDEAIQEGSYFRGDNERDILIGRKLADILEVGLNDRIVVTVSQAETHDLSQEMFRVSGIFYLNIREIDGGMVFVRMSKAQTMLGIKGKIHEIALKFIDPSFGQDPHLPFWDKYSQYGNEAEAWTQLLPELKATMQIVHYSMYYIGFILFGVVALSIVNTLFMSLHERMFEFGVLRAVGTRPFGIAQMIMYEAGALACLSIGLGIILGFFITLLFSRIGIDYTGIEFASVTFRELLYPVLEVRQFFIYPFWVLIFTLVAGIYPAVFAARMKPANSMRKSL